MSKGTAAHGRMNKGASHIICRRCGNHAYHKKKKICAKCGYGKTPRQRGYNWNRKTE